MSEGIRGGFWWVEARLWHGCVACGESNNG
jgi:hypothetical protein